MPPTAASRFSPVTHHERAVRAHRRREKAESTHSRHFKKKRPLKTEAELLVRGMTVVDASATAICDTCYSRWQHAAIAPTTASSAVPIRLRLRTPSPSPRFTPKPNPRQPTPTPHRQLEDAVQCAMDVLSVLPAVATSVRVLEPAMVPHCRNALLEAQDQVSTLLAAL